VQIVHARNVGGILPPGQAEFRPARRGRHFPHDSGMSNKPRPEAYTEVAQAIGQRIRWARELVEPNRAEFARAMGVDRSTIRDIESGRRPPSIFAVIEISHRLRVSPNYILLGKMQDVDGELAGRLAVQHPELVQTWPSDDTPGTGSSGSTSKRPKRQAGEGRRPPL
jgi:transcriptional regulator with XRE-family HTH domain